jgi:hypothetical protein
MGEMPPVFRELLNDDAVVLDVSSGRATRKFRVAVPILEQATAETDIDALTPNLGDPHPAYASLKYKGYEIRRVNNWRTSWEVQYNYEYEGFGTLDNESPFDRDPEVSWFSRVENREFFKDVNGAEATNTAGVPFDPSPSALAISTGLSYVRNERQTGARWNTIMTWMAGRRVGVNSDTFTIDGQSIPAQLAIMWIERIDRIKEGDTVYRRTAYNFEFVPDRTVTGPVGSGTSVTPAKAQHVVVANTGYAIKDSGDLTKLKPIQLAGTATQQALFIDGAGTARSVTETNRTYQAYPLYAFAPFGFS